jgi:GT2 family glycosyltransferase
MTIIQNFPYTLSELLEFALKNLAKEDFCAAFQLADKACRLTNQPDINALLLRATILSKHGNNTDAINDFTTAHLLIPSNQTIAFSLLRLCEADLKKHLTIFTQTLVYLLRQAPELSHNTEVITWLTHSGLPVLGAAWRQDDFVVGWAINSHDPHAKLQVELDGGFFSVETGQPTPLLVQAGLGNGYNGFRLQLPDRYHLLRLGMGGISLWGCPFIGNAPSSSPLPVKLVSTIVDVIVPVYAGRTDTLACLDAIKASSNTIAYRVVVVDDASPDTLMVKALKERAQRNEITLICRPINAGFSGAVNTALALDNSRDVILLNADALVFGNWLDRLHAAAYEREAIGTVTPLSNHGELLSYPKAMHNNPVFDVKHAELIDQTVSLLGSKQPVTIPVGVGFCFYIKRQVLNAVGFFDEATFGRGYGEDTDFCLRVEQAGFRNVCAANTYVVHWGSRSFGTEKNYLVEQNLPQVHIRYPQHAKGYEQFLADKPLYDFYRQLQRHLLAKLLPPLKADLYLGSAESKKDLTFTLKALEQVPGEWVVSLIVSGITGLDTINYNSPAQALELREDIVAAGFKNLVIKSLGAWPVDLIDQLCDGFMPYQFNFEDYSGYCPRKYRLIANAVLCNDPLDSDTCNRCVAELGPLVYGYSDIASWQERTRHLLTNASKISALTPEIAQAYSRRFVAFKILKLTNQTEKKSPPVLKLSLLSKAPMRIAVLNASSLAEGFLQLIEQARKAAQQGLLVEFIVLGRTLNNNQLGQLTNVVLIGPVKEAHIEQALKLHNCKAIANFSPCAPIRRDVTQTARQFNLPLVFDCKAA